MITYRELVNGCRSLGLDPGKPVLVHASFASFGDEVRGGAEALIGSLLVNSAGVMAPVFTYKTMVIPETGPENNGCAYGKGSDLNRMAEFFTPDMPADRIMGLLPETLRRCMGAKRSSHPILSFAALSLDEAIAAQTLHDPFGPLRCLMELDAIVVLIGVDHRVNTSLHLAEALAGRRQFLRWVLTPDGILECPGFPGCSEGFNQVQPSLEDITVRVEVGEAVILALPIREMVERAIQILHTDTAALLCRRTGCDCCEAVRAAPVALGKAFEGSARL
jgi:aminoglycoside 3-N-acetyltransferase